MLRAVLASLLLAAALAPAASVAASEDERIDYLIAVVEAMPDAQFIRNGSVYDAKAAAAHLRLKRRLAGARVHTAEDFIRYCGTESSSSGQPYEIRFADGSVVSSAEFLRRKLAEFDSAHRQGE